MAEILDTKSEGNFDGEKTVGILAYVTLIGFIIGIVLNSSKEKGEEKSFGAFHLRQALGLFIIMIGLYIAISIITVIFIMISPYLAVITGLLTTVMGLGGLALIIIGIINASNGEKKEIPLLGSLASKMLGSTFE